MDRSTFKAWIKAFRLHTLPLAIAGIGLGSFIAAAHGHFDLWIAAFALLTALLLQILSNLANDYGDAIHGADTGERVGPERMVQKGFITPGEMKRAIILFVILTLVCGLWLVYLSVTRVGWWIAVVFIAMGILSIMAAYAYTASSRPYGYRGFGDIAVFIFFGLLAVGGTFYLQTGYLELWVLLPACSIGLFSTAVLNVNNIRDLQTDRKTGKHTIPVRLGLKNAKIYHSLLLIFGVLCSLGYALHIYDHPVQYLFLPVLLVFIINGRGIWKGHKAVDFAPYLKQMAISTFIYSLVFGVSLLF